MSKAPLSGPLKNLLQAFENSEEAKSFIVTPPAHAGAAFEFTQPYFHAHNQLMLKKQMSEELTILVAALAAGLITHLAYYTQLKQSFNQIVFTPEDMEKHNVVLGSSLNLERGGAVALWTPNNGPGAFIGVRTEIGVFPVCQMSDLQSEVFKLRQYNLENYHFAPRSVYHRTGFGQPMGPALNFPQMATPSWSQPVMSTDIGDAKAEDVLGALLISVKYSAGILTQGETDAVLEKYVEEITKTTDMSSEAKATLCSNLQAELYEPVLTWKNFLKAMDVVGMTEMQLTLEGVLQNGRPYVKTYRLDTSLWDPSK